MLSKYNIKIIYYLGSQNDKVDALTRISKSKSNRLDDKRVRQQYQIILTFNRLKLDKIEFIIKVINNLIYYRIADENKIDKYYTKIRNAIIKNKKKLEEITLAKYSI